MTATQIPAIVLAMGLSTLPVVAYAQTSGKTDVAPAAPAAASVGTSGQVSDQGWTGANEPAPAPVAPTPSATQGAAPMPPATVQTAPTATGPEFQTKSPATISADEPAPAADEPVTLFGHRRIKFGGYGAIGFAGYGSSHEHRLASAQGFDRPYLHFGYGGLLLRYHVFIPESPVSISMATLLGGGAVGVTDHWEDEVHRDNADVFFVFEPQLGVHLNVTRWMRLGVDAGYRFVSGIGKFGLSESDFRGASVGGSVGFGWF